MPFTEFCCRSGGSNLNAGTLTGNSTEPGTSASFTYASGNWVASTGVFTVASGNPQSDGVAVGDFASVYADGSTVTGFVGRVTARTTTTITVSLSAKAGTAPTDGTGNRTLRIGGAWQGPNGSDAFPFGFLQNSLTDSSSNPPRVNFKNAASFLPTSAMTHSNTSGGSVFFRGYATAYGDGGRAVIDASTNAVVLLTVNTNGNLWFSDIEFAISAATGTNALVSIWPSIGAADCYFRRCVFRGARGAGLLLGSSQGVAQLNECELYGNNAANTASVGQLQISGFCRAVRCVFHDGSGSNVSGVRNSGTLYMNNCIIETNGGRGLDLNNSARAFIDSCDFYNNTGDGIGSSSVSGTNTWLFVENSNFCNNGGYGINTTGFNPIIYGRSVNNGFGAGTAANTSGQVNESKFFEVVNSVTYASNLTPWVDPANGDFRITLAAAKGAGRGTYTQTAASYSGTVGYPDIGAAQHLDSGSGGLNSVRHMTGGFSA